VIDNEPQVLQCCGVNGTCHSFLAAEGQYQCVVCNAEPNDADFQRALFSEYYHGPVAKGGIALQLCGWNRSLELCTGAIDDSNYLRMVKIFEEQEEFAAEDKSSSQTFVNVLDKGYRSVLDSLMCGQKCLQPAFAKSDEQFRRGETLHSGCVAVVRSGNERSVKRSKISWLVKRGCVDQIWDLSTLADVWLVWGFQVNFMYDMILCFDYL
jgi:hypothetical protein